MLGSRRKLARLTALKKTGQWLPGEGGSVLCFWHAQEISGHGRRQTLNPKPETAKEIAEASAPVHILAMKK